MAVTGVTFDAALDPVPATPVAPVAPVAPVVPAVPVGPVGPVLPVIPVAPVPPVGPVAPVLPVVPAPVGPVAPAAPVPTLIVKITRLGKTLDPVKSPCTSRVSPLMKLNVCVVSTHDVATAPVIVHVTDCGAPVFRKVKIPVLPSPKGDGILKAKFCTVPGVETSVAASDSEPSARTPPPSGKKITEPAESPAVVLE